MGRWAGVWLLPFMLAGCASMPPAPQPVTRPTQAEPVSFVLAGRIVVKQHEQRSSATMRWTHQPDADEILLFAPLGQTVARIQRNGQSVTLDTGEQHLIAQDAEELTQQALGWRLPLSGLEYWVLGLPAPTAAFDLQRADNGQINVLRQNGWTITYSSYASPAADSLPTRLGLSRDGLDIQLRIDEWELK